MTKIPWEKPCVDRWGRPCPEPEPRPWPEPLPFPRPKPCPPGTIEYKGRCIPGDSDPLPPIWDERDRIRPLSDKRLEGVQKGLDAAVESLGKGDAVSAGGSFGTLFDNGASRGASAGASSAVYYGEPARVVKVDLVDKLGDALRDRNDQKLKDANEEKKDTEQYWKDKKEGKPAWTNPRLHPDEVVIGGKG